MLYYPQFSTGSVAQFPIQRGITMRTIVNRLASGATIRMTDSGCQRAQWQLRYSGLTDDERSSIENLFEAAAGQLNTFVFLDPMANLLAWSEDWSQAVWTPDPLLQVVTGIPDAFGGKGAVQLTNTAQVSQEIIQNTSGPSSYLYTYSLYLRSDVPATVHLLVSSTAQTSLTAVSTGPSWTRAISSGSLGVEEDGVGFGVQLPAGVQVDAFGAQVEAQAGTGLYKKTIDRGGIYQKTRFSSDLLLVTATAPNQNMCEVELLSSLN
jgi:hypothetical protein